MNLLNLKISRCVVIGGGVLLIISVLEIALRWGFGFCDSPICIPSDEYEYIYAPSQSRHRFGNRINYNQYSQRSEEPDSTKIIVLGLGDSVINGGVQTDQSQLATTIASDSIIQILNISAGSWGPDNCAAYLKRFGVFNAKKILLVASSHDAHDIMDFVPVVGIHKSYPDKQYQLALVELFDRYVMPRLLKHSKQSDPDEKINEGVGIEKGTGRFNPGFDELKRIADRCNIGYEIYLHPDKAEMQRKEYNLQGKEIIKWANENGVRITLGLDYGESENTYRDGIHLNSDGQKILAKWLYEASHRL